MGFEQLTAAGKLGADVTVSGMQIDNNKST
jgi:hypothetical protein